MKIKDATGKEVEVFTQEEIDKKLEDQKKSLVEESEKNNISALEKYKEEHPDKTKELEDMQVKLDETNTALEEVNKNKDDKNKDDTEQVKRLREERNKAKKDLEDSIGEMKKEISDMKSSGITTVKSKALDKLTGDDKDLRDKVELEFDNYRSDEVSESQVIERMGKVFQLVTGDAPKPNFMDTIINAGSQRGDGGGKTTENKNDPNENEKAIGDKLGISKADWEKYGDKETQMTPPEQTV